MRSEKIISLMTALFILLSSLPLSSTAANILSPWTGNISADFAGGTGEKDDPYLISNAEQLAYLAQTVNAGDGFYTEYEDSEGMYIMEPKYIKLVSDIDLGGVPFTPIGDPTSWESSSFFGSFDGNGHSITGFTGAYGIFGKTYGDSVNPESDLGRISDLHVYGSVVCDHAVADIGGIVSRAQGGIIENCSFTGTVDVENGGFYYIGGVVGEMENGFVFNCTSDADIKVTDNHRGVGGVIGGAEYTAPLVDGCVNIGDIKIGGSMYAGGVIGKGNNIINSYNSGSITFEHPDSQVGGVSGYANKVINSYNIGALNGSNPIEYGSIYGISQSDSVFNCYNAGEMNISLAEDNSAYVFTLAYGGENIFALTSDFPAYIRTDDNTYMDVPVYDGMTENEMRSTSFTDTLNAYLSLNNEYTFEDYDGNTYARTYFSWKSSAQYPVFGKEEAKVTLEIFSLSESGESVGTVSMTGTEVSFSEGETVELEAVCDDVNYRFIGWYANNDLTNVLSSKKCYSFTVTDEIVKKEIYTLTALYEKATLARITVNGGPLFTVEGEEYSSQFIKQYRPSKAITVWAKDETDFAYWINGDGQIASYEPRYTFIVAYDLTLTAVYNRKLENKYTVIFVSDYGQVMHRQQMTIDDVQSLEIPIVPVKAGCEDGTWSHTKEQIADAMKNGTDVITVTPVYPEIVKTANVTVSGGKISADNTAEGTYRLNTQVTVKANEPGSGMKFAYWQDTEGNVLSYNEKYTFIVSRDIVLNAVFTESETDDETPGIADITDIVKQESVGGISFTATFSAPEGSTVNFAGIVATSDAAKAKNLTSANADYIRGNAQDKISGRFTWTKSGVDQETYWYVRAYMIYTDKDGIMHTVYSSLVSSKYSIL